MSSRSLSRGASRKKSTSSHRARAERRTRRLRLEPLEERRVLATLYWDPDGNTGNNNLGTGAGLGGAGTWDTAAGKWVDAANLPAAAPNLADDLIFWGASGAVALSNGATGVFAQSLTFKTNGYSFTTSTASPLTLGGTASVVSDPGVLATINPIVQGSAGLAKGGAGDLRLAGNNTFTGILSITAGKVIATADLNLGAVPAVAQTALVINGGTLQVNTGFNMDAKREIAIGAAGATFNNNATTNNFLVAGVIKDLAAGAGPLFLAGTGTTVYVPAAANTYSGGTHVAISTVLNVTSTGSASTANLVSGPYGVGTLFLDGGSTRSTTLAGTWTIGNSVQIAADTTFLSGSTNPLTFSGPILLTGNRTITQLSAGNIVFSGIVSDGGANFGLTLRNTSTGTLVLSGANTYGGATIINGGTLSVSSDANLGAVPGAVTPGNIIINGGTLLASAGFTLSSNRGIYLGPSAGSGNGTINVAAGTLTYGGILANNPGGTGNLIKTGAGTLAIGGAATYSGTTAVNAGILQLNAGGTISNSSGITIGAASATGTLVLANPATYSLTAGTVSIGGTGTGTLQQTAAGTVTVGSITDTGTSSLLNDVGNLTVGNGMAIDTLRVGFRNTGGNSTANLTVSAGAVAIGSGTQDLVIGSHTQPTATTTVTGTLNLATAATVSINAASILLGIIPSATAGSVGTGNFAAGNLILGNTINTLIATALTIGDSNNSGVADPPGSSVQFGAATNIVNADTISVGRKKARGTATVASGGTVLIAAKDGASPANLLVGYSDTTGATGVGTVGTFDMTGGTLNATLGQVNIGGYAAGAVGSQGVFTMGAGTVTASTVKLATVDLVAGQTTADNLTTGTLTINGGTFTVTSAITGAITDGDPDGSAGGGSSIATINLAGGTLKAASITRSTATNTFNFNWTGGTLQNLAGSNLSVAVPLTLVGSGARDLVVDVGQTVDLTGGGTTNVSAGTLRLSGAVTANFSVSGSGTLAGTATITGNVTGSGGGIIAPGNGVGILQIVGNFAPTGVVSLEVNAPFTAVGTDFDQIIVSGGTINLSAASASLLSAGGGSPPPATVLIQNNTGLPITPFLNLAEGAGVTLGAGVNARAFTATYLQGGDDFALVPGGPVGPPTTLYVNDQFVSGTVDGDLELPGTQTATVGVDAFSSVAAALAANPGFSGTIIVNGGTYAAIALGSSGITLRLVQDLTAGESNVTVPALAGDATNAVWTRFYGVAGNLVINNPAAASLDAVVTGAGALVKQGGGTLTLSAANTYSGGTSVDAGVLTITNSAATSTGLVTINSTGVFEINNLIHSGPIALNAGGTLRGIGAARENGTITFGGGSVTLATGAVGDVLTLSDAANDLTGGGAGTVINIAGGGIVTLTQNSNLSNLAKWAVGSGSTLSFSGDGQFGTAPPNAVADYFTIQGGTLRSTGGAAITIAANRGISIGNAGATLLVNSSGNFTPSSISNVAGQTGALTVNVSGAGPYVPQLQSTYSGGTTLQAGFVVPTISSVGPAGAPTSGPFGTGTLTVVAGTFRPTSTGQPTNPLTIANPLTLAGNWSIVAGSTNSLTFSGPVTLTGNRTMTQSSAGGVTLSGAIVDGGGGFGLTLGGTGVLVLAPASPSTYSGATNIFGGTLRFGIDNALPAATIVTLGDAVGAANTLDLSTFTQTNGIAGLLVRTKSTTNSSTVNIGPGATLAVNGGVTIGDNTGVGTTTLAVFNGGGTLSVNTATGSFQVGGATGAANTNNASLNLSGLGTFTANLGTGAFRVGSISSTSATSNNTVILAANNTITAARISIGADSGQGTGIQTLRLGSGTNNLNTNSLDIGLTGNITNRSSGQLLFDTATGTLQVRAADGVGRAAMNLVNTDSITATNITSTVNLAGHSSDLLLSTLTIGRRIAATGLGVTATLTFDTGVLDATTIEMGRFVSTGATAAATLNIGGGTVNVGSGGLTMATSSTAGGTANATVNLNAGTLTSAGNIVKGGGAGTTSALFNFNGGTLRAGFSSTTFMNGLDNSNIHNGGAIIDTNGFNITIGTNLVHSTLGGANATDGGLVKNGVGTLTLAGANSYNGGTMHNGGIITLASASPMGSGPLNMNSGAVRLMVNNQTVGNAIIINAGVAPVAGQGAITGPGTLNGNITITTPTDPATVNGGVFNGGTGLIVNGLVNSNVPVTVRTGTVTFNNVITAPRLSVTGTVNMGVSNILAPGASVTVGASAAGIFNLNGTNQTVNDLQLGGSQATVDTGTGTLTLNGQLTNSGNLTHVVNGNLSLGGGARTFNITNGTLDPDVRFTGSISNGTLIKAGAGEINLEGASTYAGGTQLNAGSIRLMHAQGFGTGDVNVAAGSVAMLWFNTGSNVIANNFILNGLSTQPEPAGVKDTLYGDGGGAGFSEYVLTGQITLNTTSSIGGHFFNDIRLNGRVTGPGGLTKGSVRADEASTLTLANPANDYAGPTTILQGTLRTAAAEVIPSGSAVSIAADRVLELGTFNETVGALSGAGTVLRSTSFSDDATSGISSSKTYTHALDFAATTAGGPATINGVTFTNAGVSGPNWNTNLDPAFTTQSDVTGAAPGSGIDALLEDFFYNADPLVITLSGLTAGLTYEVRLYNRTWAQNARTQNATFDEDGPGPLGTRITFEEDAPNNPAYISYRYTAVSNGLGGALPLVISIDAFVEGTYHLYGLTNEVASPLASLPTFTFGGAANTTFGGVISGPGHVVKQGTGETTLTGQGNSYFGTTTVSEGSLLLAKGGIAIPGPLVIGDADANIETVRLIAPGQIADSSAVTVSANGVLNLGGFDETIGSLAGTGQVILSQPGPVPPLAILSFNGDGNVGISTAKTYTHALDFAASTNGGAAVINGVAFTNAGVSNAPSWTTNLPGDTTWSDDTGATPGSGIDALLEDFYYNAPSLVITLGNLTPGVTYETRLYNRTWGGPPPRVQNGTFDPDGPGGVLDALTFDQDDGALNPSYIRYRYTATTNNLVITLNQQNAATYHLYGLTNEVFTPPPPGTLTVGDATSTAFSGAISGDGNLVKQGAGTLTLGGTSSYTGATTVNAGTLGVAANGALGAGGTAGNGTTVNAGGQVAISGGATIASERLTLNGTGSAANGALASIGGANTWSAPITLASAARIDVDAGTLSTNTINGAFALTVDVAAGTGNILFDGPVGGTTPLTSLTINSASSQVLVLDVALTTTGPLAATGDAGVNLTPTGVLTAGTTLALGGDLGGDVDAVGATMTLAGSFTAPGGATVTTGEDGDLVTINLPATNTTPLAVNTGAGGDTITVQTSGFGALTLDGQDGSDVYNVPLGATPGSTLLLPLLIADSGPTGIDQAIVESAGATNDTFLFTAGQLTRGSDTLNYTSGLDQLRVRGLDGSDIFNVTPSATTAYFIEGGNPTTAPGDQLLINTGGLAVTDNGSQLTLAGMQPVGYIEIETLTLTAANLTIDGGSGHDRLEIVPTSADDGQYRLVVNGVPGAWITFVDLAGLTFNGLAGNDELFLTNPPTGLFRPSGAPITFHGGGDSDKITLTGGTGATSQSITFTAPEAGTIVTATPSQTQTILFTGMEDRIQDNVPVAGPFTVTGDSSNTAFALQNAVTPAGYDLLAADNLADIYFDNKVGRFTLGGGDGNDQIEVLLTTPTSGITGGITLAGGAGNDRFGTAAHPLKPSTVFPIIVQGGDPVVPQPQVGNAATGDELNLDVTSLTGSVVVDSVSGTISGGGAQNFAYSSIEILHILGLANFEIGDVYLRLSDAPETVVVQSSGVNSIVPKVLVNRVQIPVGTPARRLIIDGRGGDDKISLNGSFLIGGGTDPNQGLDFYGGEGNDTLVGGAQRDRLFGGAGNDSLSGGAGDDYLGINPSDPADLGAGLDKLDGGAGNDILLGGQGNDSLTGGAGDDTMYGGDGNDGLSGLTGYDRLYGQAGNDTITGGTENDLLVGGEGADRLQADGGLDIIIGDTGNDYLIGGGDDDLLIAGSLRVDLAAGGTTTASTTVNDAYDQVLAAVLAGWAASGSFGRATFAATTIATPLGSTRIDLAHVQSSDAAPDTLTGDAGADWLFYSLGATPAQKDKLTLATGDTAEMDFD